MTAASQVARATFVLVLCAVSALAQTSANGTANRSIRSVLTPDQLKEREALLALKSAVSANQFGTSKIRTWKPQGGPCNPKPWPHVGCTSGRVTSLSLSNLNVAATLPLKLRQLNKLQVLQLDGNRFTGSIPAGWADPRYFLSLQTLDLHDNQLEGLLPSKAWNKKGAFAALTKLDLSENSLYGGLPVGWLASNRVFAKLTYLDLSKNKLGSSGGEVGANTFTATEGWCLRDSSFGEASDTFGWCPSRNPLPGTMPNLITLDLSYNELAGSLPNQWPQMFPNLQYLLLAGNALYNTQDTPAVLPTSWTTPLLPAAFPQLNTLVLYPGNENLCYVLNSNDGLDPDGYMELNPDNTYRIMSAESDEEHSKENPWGCPGPPRDNKPGSASLSLGASGIVVTWTAPSADLAKYIYAYRVTLWRKDPEDDTVKLLPRFNGKLLRTYKGLDPTFALPPGLSQTSGGTFTYATNQGVPFATTYKADVSCLNHDGSESDIVSSTQLLTPGVYTAPDAPAADGGTDGGTDEGTDEVLVPDSVTGPPVVPSGYTPLPASLSLTSPAGMIVAAWTAKSDSNVEGFQLSLTKSKGDDKATAVSTVFTWDQHLSLAPAAGGTRFTYTTGFSVSPGYAYVLSVRAFLSGGQVSGAASSIAVTL